MKSWLLVVCLFVAVAGCTALKGDRAVASDGATSPGPSDANLDDDPAIIPQDDDGEAPRPDDPAARARSLRKRFPGVRSVDLVKILAVSGARSGTCLSFMEPAATAKIEAAWRTTGSDEPVRFEGSRPVLDNGWTRIYRAPQGEGFELRASLEEIDVTYRNALRCICEDGPRRLEAEPVPVELRIAWKQGETPGVSAARVRDGGRKGLIPEVTTGNLVVYDFPLEGKFPKETRARCEARLSVSLLVDPAFL